MYEYRLYEAAPGKSGALHKRFEQHTLGLFKRHGFKLVGLWQPVIGSSDQLHYLLEWEDDATRERGWAAFAADKEWQAARAESERDGPLVVRIKNEIWRMAPYVRVER